MKEKAILALIAALIANAPQLSADVQLLIQAVAALLQGNPTATAADIQQQIAASLADGAATDKAVETAAI